MSWNTISMIVIFIGPISTFNNIATKSSSGNLRQQNPSPHTQNPSPYAQNSSPYAQNTSPYAQNPSPYAQNPYPHGHHPSPYAQNPYYTHYYPPKASIELPNTNYYPTSLPNTNQNPQPSTNLNSLEENVIHWLGFRVRTVYIFFQNLLNIVQARVNLNKVAHQDKGDGLGVIRGLSKLYRSGGKEVGEIAEAINDFTTVIKLFQD